MRVALTFKPQRAAPAVSRPARLCRAPRAHRPAAALELPQEWFTQPLREEETQLSKPESPRLGGDQEAGLRPSCHLLSLGLHAGPLCLPTWPVWRPRAPPGSGQDASAHAGSRAAGLVVCAQHRAEGQDSSRQQVQCKATEPDFWAPGLGLQWGTVGLSFLWSQEFPPFPLPPYPHAQASLLLTAAPPSMHLL